MRPALVRSRLSAAAWRASPPPQCWRHAATGSACSTRTTGSAARRRCWSEDGFRFDMGPTILTVPEVLRRIFAEAGRDLAKELDLIRLDPQWRCFFDDGSVLDLIEDEARMAGRSARLYRRQGDRRMAIAISSDCRAGCTRSRTLLLLALGRGHARHDRRPQELQPVHAVGRADAAHGRARLPGTIRRRVKDGRVAQMLDHFTQYVGSSPYGSPAVLCSIAHMQTDGGIWYPRGGTRAVAEGSDSAWRERTGRLI